MNGNVPGFLQKLVNLLESSNFLKHVSWSGDGKAFIINNPTIFAKEVLPAYFKHNKFQSFVRQLNLYGFRKVVIYDHNILPVSDEAVVFQHPCFIKNRPDLLNKIKRKIAQSRQSQLSLDEVEDLIDDVSELKENQKRTNKSLSSLRQENEDLWREVVSLRQKHSMQQKIMDHLIKFLVSLVQHQGKGPKRKLPRMIQKKNENDFHSHKKARTQPIPPTASSTFNADMNNASATDSPLITEIQGFNNFFPKKAVHDAKTNSVSKEIYDSLPNSQQLDFSHLISTPDHITNHDNSGCNPLPVIFGENHTSELNLDNQNSPIELPSSSKTPDAVGGTSSHFNNSFSSMISSTFSSNGLNLSDSTPTTSKENMSPGESSTTTDFNKLKSNFEILQEKLSNNQSVQLDCDLIQELFYGFADLSPHSRLIDDSLFSNPSPSVSGNELVQYSSENLANGANSEDTAEQVDLEELCKLFNE